VFRDQLNSSATVGKKKGDGEKAPVSLLALLLKAAAAASKQVPDTNASWSDEGYVRKFKQVHVSIPIPLCFLLLLFQSEMRTMCLNLNFSVLLVLFY